MDGPYASLLSTGNMFHTHFGSHFCEFDPAKRAFTFCRKRAPPVAMGMTEDDRRLRLLAPDTGEDATDCHVRGTWFMLEILLDRNGRRVGVVKPSRVCPPSDSTAQEYLWRAWARLQRGHSLPYRQARGKGGGH